MTDRPSTTINLLEADTRARNARHIIDGFSIVFPTLADLLAPDRRRPGRHPRPHRRNRGPAHPAHRVPARPRQPRRRRPGHHHRAPQRRARSARLPARRAARPRASPANGGSDEQSPPDAPPGPQNAPLRHAAHGRHQLRRPAARPDHRHPVPLAVALPLRTRPAHRGHPDRARRLGMPRSAHRVVASARRHHRRPGRGRPRRPATRPGHPRRTRLRHDRHRGHRRMAGRRDRRRPVPRTAAARPHHRHTGARRALVGAPPAPRQGPRRAHPRRLARDRPSRRAQRITGHVRRGGRVGLASPVRTGPRPDHHRRHRETPRDRIRARHLPRRRPRLPHPRRPGQPVRTADPRQGPARRRDHLARPLGRDHHRADRPRTVRRRHARPGSCCCAGTPCSVACPGRARAAASTCSWATWPPAPTW